MKNWKKQKTTSFGKDKVIEYVHTGKKEKFAGTTYTRDTTVRIEQFTEQRRIVRTRKSEYGMPPEAPDNWRVLITYSGDKVEEKWFSTEKEAKKYAMNWMQSHPDGASEVGLKKDSWMIK